MKPDMKSLRASIELTHEDGGSEFYEVVEVEGFVSLEDETCEVTSPDIEFLYSRRHCEQLRDALFDAAYRDACREEAARAALPSVSLVAEAIAASRMGFADAVASHEAASSGWESLGAAGKKCTEASANSLRLPKSARAAERAFFGDVLGED